MVGGDSFSRAHHFKEGLSVDPATIEAIVSWEKLKNVIVIKRLLGLVGFYRRFVQGFSFIAAPLAKLSRKCVPFVWTRQSEASFQELKRRLTTSPILTLPLGSGRFIVYIDASNVGLGCVLIQVGKVIAYGSR